MSPIKVETDPTDFMRPSRVAHCTPPDVLGNPGVVPIQINQLCETDQAIAIYRIQFWCPVNQMAANDSAQFSLGVEYEQNGVGRFIDTGNILSNHIVAGCRVERDALGNPTMHGEIHDFGKPVLVASNMRFAYSRWGGTGKQTALARFWYQVVPASPMLRHMLRRHYG